MLPREYRPSSFPVLMRCGGSHELAKHYPEPVADEDEGLDLDAAAEGTAAHWVCEQVLRGEPLPPIGSLAPNGVAVDRDMHEGATIYVDFVRSIAGNAKLHIEETVLCEILHPLCHGQIDLRFVNLASEDAWYGNHIVDYKHGHNFVSEYENWQLLGYAAGALDMHTQAPSVDESMPTWLHIVQPRSYGRGGVCRSWRIPPGKLIQYALRIRERLAQIDLGLSDCITGEHCRYCPAQRGCEALEAAALHAAQIARGNTPLDLTTRQAATELALLTQAAESLKHRIKGLEAQIEHDLTRGVPVPFYHLKEVTGREKWSVEPSEVISFGALFGVNLAKEPDVITPTQARKIFPAPKMLDKMATRPTSRALAEINPAETRRVFEDALPHSPEDYARAADPDYDERRAHDHATYESKLSA